MGWLGAMKRFGNFLTVAVAFSAALPFTSCRQSHEPGAASPPLTVLPVRVRVAENKPHPATEEVVGTVQSKLHAVLEAKVSGRVEKMLVTPGQMVKAGELLAQLDAREVQARLDQALATREQAGRDTERLRRLLAQNTVSRQEFETVESRLRIASAAVTEAETLLGYAKILAPFDGVITRKLAETGDLASPGRALLEMEDSAALRVEAAVPEALIGRVQMGASLAVRSTVEQQGVIGVVGEIAPTADPGSRTFNVKLDLPPKTGWRAGQFARVAVPLGETMALRVPASAVLQRGQMELVFVLVSRQAQLRLVKTGRRLGDEVEVVSGVTAGESVVVEGAAALRDGQPVEVKP